jgi:glycerol-3-phosphate dehydrogenase
MHVPQDENGKVVGVRCRDRMTGQETDVYARVVVNATGAFADDVRRFSQKDARQTVMASSGSHVTLPDFYGSGRIGMIIPKVSTLSTSDGQLRLTHDTACLTFCRSGRMDIQE